MSHLFIISAPSGTGKTTLIKEVLARYEVAYNLELITTYTTRKKRAAEQEGKDYYFISKEEFAKKKDKGFFIETTEYNEEYYGTARKSLILNKNQKHKIAILDRPGAFAVKKILPEATLIWIYPKSFDVLKTRLQKRASESQQEIAMRLTLAQQELELEKKESTYEYHIENDEFEQAIEELASIIRKEITPLYKK